MTWEQAWRGLAGLSPDAPHWIVSMVALAAIFALVVVPTSGLMSFLERKIGADLQARVGPNQAGPGGFLQPAVDFLKLLQKRPVPSRNWTEAFWLAILTMALYSTVAVLPLGSLMLLVDTDMSAFLPFWAALLLALGSMLLGFSQGTVTGWFGGVRAAAQALAGAFPALIAVLCAGVHAGAFRWSVIAGAQGASPLSWTVFNVFQLVAFLVFVVSGLVLFSAPPVDAGISVPDIHRGMASGLYGRRLSLFRLGRFYGSFLWSVMAVVLFLGAWNLPEFLVTFLRDREAWWTIQILELLWLLSKTVVLMLTVSWIAKANPRLRSDQVTDLTWKVLSPMSLVALAGVALMAGSKVLM